MASEHDGGDCDGPGTHEGRGTRNTPTTVSPRRPTSHRRPAVAPQRQVPLRTSAVLALVTGLAITTPLILRTQKHEIALGPEPAFPEAVTDSATASPGGPAAVGAASPGRTATPVSRNGTRSPAVMPSGGPSAPPAVPSAPSVPASSGTSVRGADAPAVQLSPDQATVFENQVVTLVNAQRTAHGCQALRSDARLQLAAIGHSVDMRTRGYFAHDTPDGVTPWTRIEAQGYSDPSAENIAMGQATPQAVVDAWMNSAGHRANILNCSSKAVGVGVQFGPGGPWWTQDFGYS
ncbi:MAG: CAP domain-containing protein [Catenulispora sp.]|nr:CAP domain-containing protein [Catenulispora sp.]